METEGSLPRLQKPTTCHYSEHCYVTAARNFGKGRYSVFTTVRTKPDIASQNKDSQVVKNISEYRAVAMYSEPEVQVFPKKLKQLTTVHYVITQKV